MSDTENPGATSATSTPTDPATTLATVAQVMEVQAQLRQMHDLVIEHATAVGQLHEELAKLVEAVSQDVVQLRGDVGKKLDPLDARLAQLESRVDDALVRLGVEKAPPTPATPATPVIPGEGMMFDGANWVPKPAAAEEPTS